MLSLTRYQFTINWRLENVRQLHLQVFDWRTNNMRFVDLKTPRIVLSSSLINRSLISKWLRNQMISVWIGSCKFYQRKVQVKVRKFMSTYNTCFTIECTLVVIKGTFSIQCLGHYRTHISPSYSLTFRRIIA